MASKPSTKWPKKLTLTARSMVRDLTRPSRIGWSKKWPAPTKLDLNEGELIRKDEESSEEDKQEQWVAKKMCS
jgi:hypothetical protein